MKRNIFNKTVCIFTFIIVIMILLFLILNQYVSNCYDGNIYSNNKEKSIQDGFFISYYCPNHDSITLLDRKIKTPICWLEKSRKSKHLLLFFQYEEIDPSSINFILPDTMKKEKVDYMFSIFGDSVLPHLLNYNKSLGYIYQYDSDQFEFIFFVSQPSKDSGWVKEIIVDTIKYTKCKY